MALPFVVEFGKVGEARSNAMRLHQTAVDWLNEAPGKLETAKNVLIGQQGRYTQSYIEEQLRNEYNSAAESFEYKMNLAFDALDNYAQVATDEAGRLREKAESAYSFDRLSFLEKEYTSALATSLNGAGAKAIELREQAKGDTHKLRALRAAALPALQDEAQKFLDNARGYKALEAKNLLLADAENEVSDDVKALEAIPAEARRLQGELIPLGIRTEGQIAAVGYGRFASNSHGWTTPFNYRFSGQSGNPVTIVPAAGVRVVDSQHGFARVAA